MTYEQFKIDSYPEQQFRVSRISPVDLMAITQTIDFEKYEAMREKEQFILSVTTTGYGKRSSSYEYRVTGRGGQGIANMEMSARNK